MQADNTREIPLTKGKVAIVDAEDYERVAAHKWCAVEKEHGWYVQRGLWVNRKRVMQMMHWFIMGIKCVDHKNGDGLDNRRCNLRPASARQQMQNRAKPKNNRSGFKGVRFRVLRTKSVWTAQIESKHIGVFNDPVLAAQAYDAKARELYGEFARLNFPLKRGL